MAQLNIAGAGYTAKFTFAFKNKADKEFNDVDAHGNRPGGFNQIYQGLLQFDLDALRAFWLCGLAHLSKQPSRIEIEAALEERIEEDGDVEPLFQEAFREIDESGFFKKAVKTFWENLELFESVASEEEKEQAKAGIEMMKTARVELLGNKQIALVKSNKSIETQQDI
ncbi:tail assembly chaperone [Lysinibacillus fusiformis]|uniref:tail assembly chaperone n=1 Tax=Lysinibacillus fusiformis TaxID=28031 RepID=UPI003818BFCA